jgi:hypothetical protein
MLFYQHENDRTVILMILKSYLAVVIKQKFEISFP